MHDEGESSDDDFGPMPVATTEQNRVGNEKDEDELMPKKKKARRLDFEKVFLENLPDADCYEHSFMHRDIVTHVAVSKTAEFVMTASTDGHVKFWKKMLQGIEFVKHYQAHLGPIHAFLVSGDEKMLVTTSEDKMIKFFEIVGFDMSNMIAVEYVPTAAAWLSGPKNINDRVAIADKSSGDIRIYKSEGSQLPIHTILVHASPVRCMASCPATQAVISADSRGIIEIWDVESYQQPASASGRLAFQLKSDTDLYDLAKHRAVPYSLAASPSGQLFATYSSDKQVRIFDFKRGKLTRQYDEAVSRYTATTTTVSVADPEDGRIVSVPMDSFELGKRQATERELEASPDTLALSNIVFDESGNFLIFGTLKGIKIVNVVTNKVARVVGNGESGERFLAVALYQGVPKVDTQLLLSRAGGSASTVKAGDSSGGRGGGSLMGQTVDEMNKAPQSDPTIFCTAFKRRRFYCFSRREPDEEAEARDKFNEMPSEEERALGGSEQVAKTLSDTAVLRTSLGDIHIKLFPQECPRTIENFVTHIRNGYYNNLIFHRVIKGFMVQTGDPRGDGTGGESIWGGEFEDEIVKSLKHDRPFTVSMANAGPGTNGSQFFITTVATPWLDGKHTVFGRVTGGFEVVQQIEGARVNKLDKPYNDIKILSAEA